MNREGWGRKKCPDVLLGVNHFFTNEMHLKVTSAHDTHLQLDSAQPLAST